MASNRMCHVSMVLVTSATPTRIALGQTVIALTNGVMSARGFAGTVLVCAPMKIRGHLRIDACAIGAGLVWIVMATVRRMSGLGAALILAVVHLLIA
tara:strand:- start:259 stop:549 length:291 start_codon:yes stop_codon:yes gene_type:complete